MSDTHVFDCYRIDDGEEHYYAARDKMDAFKQHRLLFDIDVEDLEQAEITLVDDDLEIPVRMGEPYDNDAEVITKTARDWIETQGQGIISTTSW